MDQPGVLGIVIAHVRPRVISLVDMYCFSFNLFYSWGFGAGRPFLFSFFFLFFFFLFLPRILPHPAEYGAKEDVVSETLSRRWGWLGTWPGGVAGCPGTHRLISS